MPHPRPPLQSSPYPREMEVAMPKTNKDGRARKSEIPSTLERSGQKAQDTFAQTFDSAEEQYGEEGRAHAVAWSAVEQKYEKNDNGDWVEK